MAFGAIDWGFDSYQISFDVITSSHSQKNCDIWTLLKDNYIKDFLNNPSFFSIFSWKLFFKLKYWNVSINSAKKY